MKILKSPHPMLFKECSPVKVFDKELRTTLDKMYDLMLKNNGIGLSGNQVDLDMFAFVMQKSNGERLNVVNPFITGKSRAMSDIKEGCLSFPGEFLVTGVRSSWIQAEYQDEFGEHKKVTLKELDAVVFQHELGHVNGQVFIQSKMIPKDKKKQLYKKWGMK